ncbi:MAG: neutral/alkaline non-lysosomal ceramidase N-terminal domain-containing protein, partial [Bacteroidales bacterium]|nr:neutral/alkaline non-lysosomal ceramidase N-terminal domain-containing protein [Bacteroidales bacterium]
MFLHGYPHVERISKGVHDPLFASALIIDNGITQIGFCAVDVVFISKEITKKVRSQVHKETGIAEQNLMISASHTHSGPVTFSDIFYDPVVPKADPKYISYLVEKLVHVYVNAFKSKKECKIAITTADGSEVGGNRRSKTDTIDPEVPVIVLKDTITDKVFALSTIYCMHPTILHEDSKLISADFPGYTRAYIKKELGEDVILLYHTGPSGNQSPRHFIKSNTFDEAQRLGYILGERILKRTQQLESSDFKEWVSLYVQESHIMLPKKEFMSINAAKEKVIIVKNKLEQMRLENSPGPEIRTVECDWFGAEENKQLAEMAKNGRLEKIYQSVLPAEINIIRIDDKYFVFLPGEMFVEYSLIIKENSPDNAFITSLSNGVLAGYIVTEEAEQEGGYEASNSIFPASAGKVLVNQVLDMLEKTDSKGR